MKKRIFFAILLIFFISIPHSYSQTEEAGRESLYDAFEAVAVAENVGGDVSELVLDFNMLISSLENGVLDSEDVERIVTDLVSQASLVERSGIRETQYNYVVAGSVVLVLLVSSGLVWVYGSRVFWSVWLRIKSGWIVKRL